MIALYEKFLDVERREGWMSREIDGVWVWQLIRWTVFMRIVLPHAEKLGQAHPDLHRLEKSDLSPGERVLRKLRKGLAWFCNATIYNPALALRRRQVLFAMTPRQTPLEDGRIASVMLDFHVGYLKSSFALLEFPGQSYTVQPRGRRVFHGGVFDFEFRRMRKSAWFAGTEQMRQRLSNEISNVLQREFGCAERTWICDLVDGALLRHAVYSRRMVRWLRRLGVRLVVTSVHYMVETMLLAKAARELGIAVVEMQHGFVYGAHPAYNLPVPGGAYIPDIFFSWGDYWNGQMRNYPLVKTVSTGYPYMDYHLRRYPPAARCDKSGPLRALFISQGSVADELVDHALELRKLLPLNAVHIAYKLHPDETLTWKEFHPQLVDSGIEVISSADRNIYRCLQECDVTVGDCSTALIEGFMWGRRAYVFRGMPGAETVEGFARQGLLTYVDSVRQLADELDRARREKTSLDLVGGSDLWRPNSAKRLAAEFDALVIAARGL